ncbi:UNVERIFIED_CONTAM: hypothetical protein RMT77_017006 [Armadillidium vulgare]
MKGKFLSIFLLYLYSDFCKFQQFTANQNLKKRYYKILATKNIKIPYVTSKQVNWFEAYSDKNAFDFEVSIGGTRLQICKEETEKSDFFSVIKDCKHMPITLFSQDIVYKIFMDLQAFDYMDALKYNDFTFSEIIIHNRGTTDFYVRTFVEPKCNAPLSLLKQCGMNSVEDKFSLTTGTRTSISKNWPWLVTFMDITQDWEGRDPYNCGGVLITDRFVLTSFKCIVEIRGLRIDLVKVRLLGRFDNAHENFYSIDFKTEAIKIHDNKGVLALVKLNSSTRETNPPICLPPPNRNWNNKQGYVIEIERFSLRESLVQIWNQSKCDEVLKRRNLEVTDKICATVTGEIHHCPFHAVRFLVAQILPMPHWHVIGINSFASPFCERSANPIVFFKVDKYLDWINSNIDI